jgi:pimeloyl-ACP methyl ester carboxylesterase
MIDRRDFLKVSGMAFAAGFGQSSAARTVQTPTLDVGYVESGSATGFPVILLHGFPDDVHAYDDVAPPLAAKGYRVLVPYLRGYGTTRFRNPNTPRMAEQAAIGQDLLDFADALTLRTFAVAGYDWGGRAASVAAALHPDRVRAAVLVGGYSIQDVFSAPRPAAPQTEAAFWYQWYFNTERGRAGLQANRRAFCRFLWQLWSPSWHFSDEEFNRTAASFDNPDFVDVVIHSYRHRNGNAPGEPRFKAIEAQLAQRPKIQAPSITLYGADDGVAPPARTSSPLEQAAFVSLIARRVIPGVGHFMPRERPEAVSSAMLELLEATR